MNSATLWVRGPGLGWLPAVWRQPRTWRTVARFAVYGPLVGGLPYLVFIISIPFAYLFGFVPAVVAGLAFASWYHVPGRVPTWPWRAVMGALAGAVAVAGVSLYDLLATPGAPSDYAWLVALHGIPAAVVMALLEAPPRFSSAPEGRCLAHARRPQVARRPGDGRP